MLFQILSFLLDIVVGALAGACLLRAYMQRQRISFRNPVGNFIFALTDWLVLPLRRVLPTKGGWDWGSLLGAYLLMLAEQLILWGLAPGAAGLAVLPVLALFGVMRLVISGLTALVIVNAVLSWFPTTQSSMTDVLNQLVEPLLRPFRGVIPLIGGIDLSPLALLVLLQIATIVLGNVQGQVLRGLLAG
ncbi:MAG: YggT family protein [Burkholderiales bacterium]